MSRLLMNGFLVLIFSQSSFLYAQEAASVMPQLKKKIRHFAVIEEGLYRGAQPDLEGFKLLKELGIQTVINFRHEKKVIEKERKWLEDLGMTYINLPWRIQRHPKEPVMQEFFDALDREQGPIFMHCRRGAERTGVADALYRYYRQGLSREEAWSKAMEGYHTKMIWEPFIKWRINDFHKNLGDRDHVKRA